MSKSKLTESDLKSSIRPFDQDSDLLHINLSDLHFVSFPDSFHHIVDTKKVAQLDLICNGFKTLPEEIFLCKKLKKLYLYNNSKLTSLSSALFTCNKIEELYVGACSRLCTIPNEIQQLHVLRILKAQNCGLNQFPVHVTRCAQLTHLDLSDNTIPTMPPALYSLIRLTHLNLNRNKIKDVAPGLENLSKIRVLELASNEIEKIPMDICNCKKLEQLDLRNNQLKIPNSILEQRYNPKEILLHIHRIANSKGAFDIRRNWFFLGKHESGKTSVVNSILEDGPKPTREVDRTHVLEKYAFRRTKNRKQYNIRMYDFGGHPCYNATTAVYLNENSLFSIVFDLSKHNTSDFYPNIKLWVDLVSARMPGAHIQMVGTHSDCLPGDNEISGILESVITYIHHEENTKLKKLQQMKESCDSESPTKYSDDIMKLLATRPRLPMEAFPVSCTEYTGFDRLLEETFGIFENETLSAINIPLTWQSLAERIQQKQGSTSNHWLTMEEVQTLAQDIGLDDDSLTATLEYLRVCGDILWFPQSGRLKNIIFHKPVKLTEIFKVIISHDIESMFSRTSDGFHSLTNAVIENLKKDLENTGTISKDTMQRILLSQKYSDAYFPVILELLVKFDIGYLVPARANVYDTETVTAVRIPWYVKQSRPRIRCWEDESTADGHEKQFSVKFSFSSRIPSNLFQTILVRLHEFVDLRIDWVDGFYGSKDCNQILLELPENSNGEDILLQMRGKGQREIWLFSEPMLNEVQEIIAQWPGLDCTRWILCPMCVKVGAPHPTQYDYSYLEERQPIVVKDECRRCPDKHPQGISSDEIYPFLAVDAQKETHSDQSSEHKYQTKRALQRQRGWIVDHTETENGLLDRLIEMDVLTLQKKEEIKLNSTIFEQVRRLLDHLDKRPVEDLEKFIHALRKTEQNHVADKVERCCFSSV